MRAECAYSAMSSKKRQRAKSSKPDQPIACHLKHGLLMWSTRIKVSAPESEQVPELATTGGARIDKRPNCMYYLIFWRLCAR